MTILSIQFFLFITVLLVAYYSVPVRIRLWIILLGSVIFYASYGPVLLVFPCVVIVKDYLTARYMDHLFGPSRTVLLAVSIVFNVVLLIGFKHAGPLNIVFGSWGIQHSTQAQDTLKLLGLSFYSLQSIGYLTDVYRGRHAEQGLKIYATYILFFPQITSGPIERASHMLPQFSSPPNFNATRFTDGLRLILWGVAKKLLLVSRIGAVVDPVFANPTTNTGSALLMAAMLYYFQIYMDFSAYTDIARGVARLFGIELIRNFNHPFDSTSIRDFWRRWHISLTSWLRDYIYIPLGGNRKGIVVTLRNILIVFLVSGIWHGSGLRFAVWGLGHGLFICFERIIGELLPIKTTTFSRILGVVYSFMTVSLLWIPFRSDSIATTLNIYSRIFYDISRLIYATRLPTYTSTSGNAGNIFLVTYGIVLVLFTEYALADKRFRILLSARYTLFRWTVYYTLIILSIFFGSFGPMNFIYAQF